MVRQKESVWCTTALPGADVYHGADCARLSVLFVMSLALEENGCGGQVAPVRVAAEAAGKALVELLSPLAVKVVLPTLLDNTETKKHWQARFPSVSSFASPCARLSHVMCQSCFSCANEQLANWHNQPG